MNRVGAIIIDLFGDLVEERSKGWCLMSACHENSTRFDDTGKSLYAQSMPHCKIQSMARAADPQRMVVVECGLVHALQKFFAAKISVKFG
jgi:hypothetical protein